MKLKQDSWSDVYKIMIHYYYYYQQLYCWKNIGNFLENYHRNLPEKYEIFWQNFPAPHHYCTPLVQVSSG